MKYMDVPIRFPMRSCLWEILQQCRMLVLNGIKPKLNCNLLNFLEFSKYTFTRVGHYYFSND